MLVPRLQCVNRTGVDACGGHQRGFAAAGSVHNTWVLTAYGCGREGDRGRAGTRKVDLHSLITRAAGLYGNVQRPPETLCWRKQPSSLLDVRSRRVPSVVPVAGYPGTCMSGTVPYRFPSHTRPTYSFCPRRAFCFGYRNDIRSVTPRVHASSSRSSL